MRRFAILAVVVVVLAGLAAAALPLIVSTDLFKNRIADQIASWTGRAVTITGDPSLSIYPHLTVTVGNVAIANPAGFDEAPFIAAESLAARLQLLPLLIGRTEFDAFEITAPRVHLIRNADSKDNWRMAEGKIGAEATDIDPDRGDDAAATNIPAIRLGELRVTNATVVYDDLVADHHEEMTGVELEISWPTTGSTATGGGKLAWRGEPIEFNASVDSPRDLMAGGSSAMRFAIASTPLRASFNGKALRLDGMQLEGEASLTTPSLRRTVEWLGIPMGTGPILGAASVAGTVNWIGRSVSFSDATVELDGNAAEGVISASFEGPRPSLQGTLALDRLDLSPYVEAARAGVIGEGSWLIAPTRLPVVTAMNADLRISTGEILLGSARIGAAAVSVVAQEDGLTVNVGEAQFYGGAMTARIAAQMSEDSLTGSANIKFDAVPARVALADFTTIDALDGTAAANIDITANGRSWGEFVLSIAGAAGITVSDGSLTGVDVALLASAATDPLADALPLGTGSTPFDQLSGSIEIAEGRLMTDDLAIEGDGYDVTLTGWGSLASGLVEAKAKLSMTAGGGRRVDVPLLIGGTWRDPAIRADPDRRSEDAASGLPDLPG
jgi:uncharacterized protein involved in outer membrane biogenesis